MIFKLIERILETTTLTAEDIQIESGNVVIEGEKELEAYTPPDTITLETVTFEPTKDDEVAEIALETELNTKETELEAFISDFRAKEMEEFQVLKTNVNLTTEQKIEKFESPSFALLDKSRANVNLGTDLTTLRNEVNAEIPKIYDEMKKVVDLLDRLILTYNSYKEFETEVYQAYYQKNLSSRPTVDTDK